MAVLAALVLLSALIGLAVVAGRYRAEQRENARVRAIFSRYLAPPVVEELLRRKDPRLYLGRSMHATIVVCRIWNFAGFTESLSAEETLRYLNEFFALAGTSIQRYRGMIDKFLADGIVGVFGVPLEDPEAEEHALRAALDIVRLVDAMDRRWRSQGRKSFQVGIGIDSGEVIAGDAGFHERRDFTVVGPHALYAERLQAVTADISVSIVASASTCATLGQRFIFVPLTGHPLPGLKRLADACIVVGANVDADPPIRLPADGFAETKLQAVPAVAAPDAPFAPAPSPPPPRPPEPARAMPPGAANVARMSPPPPEIVPLPRIDVADPVTPLRARRRGGDPDAEMPFGFGSGGRGDDAPIFPDIPHPPRRAAYEDGEGPPIPLPS